MRQWWLRQWNDIKGNAKWAGVLALSGIIGVAVRDALRYFLNIPIWAGWLILLTLFMIVFIWTTRSMQPRAAQQESIQPTGGGLAIGIPTLSSLLGQNPQVTFDARRLPKPITAL